LPSSERYEIPIVARVKPIDGRSLWVVASSPTGVPTLLNVDLRGQARPVLKESEKDLGWAIPSPDGRHLAVWEASGSSNAWLLEGF